MMDMDFVLDKLAGRVWIWEQNFIRSIFFSFFTWTS